MMIQWMIGMVRVPVARVARVLALAGVGLVAGVGSAAGQGLPPAPAEMEAVAWMEGEWGGEGWIEQGGQRVTFSGTERVERRMGGRLLVVEGSFTAYMGPELGDVPVHQALGVLSWEPAAERYAFRTYTARGANGSANEAEATDGRLEWRYEDAGGGLIRYTITRTDAGEWHEAGHASRDGETWHQFFEIVLARR